MFGTNREQIKHGQTIDVLESESLGLRIEVARRGAELISLQRLDKKGQWHPFLWRDGDVSGEGPGWAGHCTVMGFYTHRLLNGRGDYAGDTIEGGTHGVLRHIKFGPPSYSAEHGAHLTYHLNHNTYKKPDYPRKVDVELTYRLRHQELEVEFVFHNREHHHPAHLQFGLHPGFQVSSNLEPGEVELIAPSGNYLRHVAAENFLTGEVQSFNHNGGPLEFERAKLEDSYLFETRHIAENERHFTLRDKAWRREVIIDCKSAPYLTLWANHPGFLCVEPCWGLPDHQEQRPFPEKEGIQLIEPGGKLKAGCSIRPRFLDA
jgi:galactose mutarotase-like enzyme